MNAPATAKLPDIASTNVGALVRLTPRDSLNSPALVDAFMSSVKASVDARQVKITLDLSAVQLINSQGLEALLDAQDMLLRRGGWLKYSNASVLILEIFDVCGITGYIKSVDVNAESERARAGGAKDQSKQRLGDILLDMSLISDEQIVEATGLQEQTGMRIGHIVVDKGWVSEQDLLVALSHQLSIPVIRLRPGASPRIRLHC